MTVTTKPPEQRLFERVSQLWNDGLIRLKTFQIIDDTCSDSEGIYRIFHVEGYCFETSHDYDHAGDGRLYYGFKPIWGGPHDDLTPKKAIDLVTFETRQYAAYSVESPDLFLGNIEYAAAVAGVLSKKEQNEMFSLWHSLYGHTYGHSAVTFKLNYR